MADPARVNTSHSQESALSTMKQSSSLVPFGVDIQADRMKLLYEEEYIMKSANFNGWEAEALKFHAATKQEIENLLVQVRSN